MNFLREFASAKVDDPSRRTQSIRKTVSRRKDGNEKRSSKNSRQQTHFYDPDNKGSNESFSDDLKSSDLDRRQVEATTNVEHAEAALAKERKRLEHLELQRQEVENQDVERLARQDENARLSPRERNHRQFQRAVSRVERRALRDIEHLERKFAYSDKLFEVRMQDEDAKAEQAAEAADTGSYEA